MNTFVFPARRKRSIVETALMYDIVGRTTAIHNDSPIVVWTGRSRLGKTTTAEWLVDRVNRAFNSSNPDAFQARHYQATELASWHSVDKTAMGAFYSGVLGTLDDGLYRRLRAPDLAKHVVAGLIRNRIELVCLDEAGLYSIPAIRGLVTVRDQAVKQQHRLTIVLIGMDDLPTKLESNAQIAGRIHEWCYFKPYHLAETIKIVSQLSDLWADPSSDDNEIRRQLEFVHEISGGVPGILIPYLGKVERELAASQRQLSVPFLKAVYLRTLNDKERSQTAARSGFTADRTLNMETAK